MPRAFKGIARHVLGARRARGLAGRVAALRGRSLALVYHRVEPEVDGSGVVPSVPVDLFRRQVEALGELGAIVPLEALLRSGRVRLEPRFALTFDDDFVTHVDNVLPVLRSLGVPATFFLSGRSLHGLGPYWFEELDALFITRGPRATARLLGLDGVADPERVAAACERSPELQARVAEAAPRIDVAPLDAGRIRGLSEAGMTIGFHTLEHRTLTALDDDGLDDALSRGRRELRDVVGQSPSLFAYPHGKADARVARRVRAAGFRGAWTGRPEPVRFGASRYLLGRWEPGAVDIDAFLVGAASKLNAYRVGR